MITFDFVEKLLLAVNLYENKICTGEEAAQCRGCLERRVQSAGYRIVTSIGNVIKEENKL